MKRFILHIISVLTLGCVILASPCRAEGDSVKSKNRTDLQLFYLKSGNVKTFTTTLNYVNNGNSRPNKHALVKLFGGENKETPVGEVIINERGKTVFNLKKDAQLPKDKDGFSYLTAIYDGNDSIEAGESQVKFQDINLTMELRAQDSTKTVLVNCYTLNDKGVKIPQKDIPINFCVERMFSNLKVGDATTDENGDCSFDFPNNIVGDSVGNLTILARIEENDNYGNAEVKQPSRWGVPTFHKIPLGYRALWTQVAPTWMIITLVIMLSGVWGHYIYAIVKISRIPKQAGTAGEQKS